MKCQPPACRQTYGLHSEQISTYQHLGGVEEVGGDCVVRSKLNKFEHVEGTWKEGQARGGRGTQRSSSAEQTQLETLPSRNFIRA